MTGMSQTNCCCGTGDPCIDCNPEQDICCIICHHDMWQIEPIMLGCSGPYVFYSGDTCTIPTRNTNLCGCFNTQWHFDHTTGLSWRPAWDNTSHACMPFIKLSWGVLDGCEQVLVRLTVTAARKIEDGRYSYFTFTASKVEDYDWYTRAIQFDDPWYVGANSAYPDDYPLPAPKIAFQVCPSTYVEFPEPEDQRIYLKAFRQRKAGSVWNNQAGPGSISPAYGKGNCVCSKSAACPPSWAAVPTYVYWKYLPYTHEVSVWVDWPIHAPSQFSTEVPYDECRWADTDIYCYVSDTERWRIFRVDNCGDSETDPPLFCRKSTLCVLLSVDGGENSAFYHLTWDSEDERYELAASAVPGGKPYTIEITLTENGTTPLDDLRIWDLVVIIRSTVDSSIILEYEETLEIRCSYSFTRESDLVVPIDPEETWELTISSTCPDAPDPPPECDPGCWPECVMCPERKSLYLVIDDDPDCCLAGSYALTWSGTGTVGSYYLAAPTGASTASCGLISAFTVTCVDETTIHVSITYRVIYGLEINSVTESYNLTVACVDGQMESEPVSYTLTGDQDGLCGSGNDYGGNIRVVSA